MRNRAEEIIQAAEADNIPPEMIANVGVGLFKWIVVMMVNRNGRMKKELEAVKNRLTEIEQKLNINA